MYFQKRENKKEVKIKLFAPK